MSNLSKQMPRLHGFLMMSIKNLFSCHLPMFFMPNHSFQIILEIEIGGNDIETYLKARKEKPREPLIIMNNELTPMLVEEIVNSSSYKAKLSFANKDGDPIGPPIIESTTVTV